MNVACHAHGKEGMLRAILAGVQTIEHGSYLDDEVIAAMKKHGTWLIPTLSAGRYLAESAQAVGSFPEAVPRVPPSLLPVVVRPWSQPTPSSARYEGSITCARRLDIRTLEKNGVFIIV